MKSKLFASLMILFLGVTAMAQTVRISGTVVDAIGPVIGASVIESGTQNGAITGLDGDFSLLVKNLRFYNLKVYQQNPWNMVCNRIVLYPNSQK